MLCCPAQMAFELQMWSMILGEITSLGRKETVSGGEEDKHSDYALALSAPNVSIRSTSVGQRTDPLLSRRTVDLAPLRATTRVRRDMIPTIKGGQIIKRLKLRRCCAQGSSGGEGRIEEAYEPPDRLRMSMCGSFSA
jgi:hypothetical protein